MHNLRLRVATLFALARPYSFKFGLCLFITLRCVEQGACQEPSKQSPPATYRIVFDEGVASQEHSQLTMKVDIYIMDQNGEHVRQLTSDHRSRTPSWSADAKQIFFLRETTLRTGGSAGPYMTPLTMAVPLDVFRMGSDGGSPSRIASIGPDALDVVWMPDGEHVAARISNRRNLQVLIAPPGRLSTKFEGVIPLDQFVKESETASAKDRKWHWARLTEFFPPVDNLLPVLYANWGNLDATIQDDIDFQRRLPFEADKSAALKVLDTVGKSVSPNSLAFDTAWSPIGDRISYSMSSDDRGAALRVTGFPKQENIDPRTITEQGLDAHGPAWSEDGSRIAFMGLWENSSQIFIIDADGNHLTQISHDPGVSCFHPSWSPDSRRIVAECRQNLVVSLTGIAAQLTWYSNIFLFDVDKPSAKPRSLTNCWGPQSLASTAEAFSAAPPSVNTNPACGAHHPSFMPVSRPIAAPAGGATANSTRALGAMPSTQQSFVNVTPE
jgi:hypothetical protein